MSTRRAVLVLAAAALGPLACSAPPPAPSARPASDAPADPRGACVPQSAGPDVPTGKLRLVIASGGTGGVFYPYGGGLARVLSARLPKAEATVEVTGGSVDNLKLVDAGEADLGFSTVDSAWDAFRGVGAYQDTGPVAACAVAVLYRSYVHVVALEGSGVDAVGGLKGKRVSVGAAGSSTEVAADRMLEAAGLDPRKDVSRDNLSVAESASALADEKIDAFFWIGGLPTAAVTDLASTSRRRLRFLPAADHLQAMRARGGPVYEAAVLPKGTYPGQEADVPGVGVDNVLLVGAAMPEARVEAILAAVFDDLAQVHRIHPEAAKLSLEAAAQGSSIPFHPGAIRFYQQRGAWKPR